MTLDLCSLYLTMQVIFLTTGMFLVSEPSHSVLFIITKVSAKYLAGAVSQSMVV